MLTKEGAFLEIMKIIFFFDIFIILESADICLLKEFLISLLRNKINTKFRYRK